MGDPGTERGEAQAEVFRTQPLLLASGQGGFEARPHPPQLSQSLLVAAGFSALHENLLCFLNNILGLFSPDYKGSIN